MRSLFLRLGQPSATSNTTLLWLFVLVTLATLLTSSQSLGVSTGSIALPALVTTAIFILLVIAARGPPRRLTQPGLRSTATLGVVVTAWLLRSAILALLLSRQLGADGDIQVIRVVISILFVLFIMLITSDLIDHRAAHRVLVAELTNRRMDLRLSQATFGERLVQARSELDQAIRGTREPSRSLLDLAFDVNRDPVREVQPAQLLHDIVRLSIRRALADLAASEVTVIRAPTPEHVEPLERAGVNQRIDIVNCIRPALMVVPLRVFTLFVFLGFTSSVNALSSTVVLLLAETISSAGFTAHSAATGSEAQRLFAAKDPDGAILDVDLGHGLNGFDLCDAFVKHNPAIAVVFLTHLPDSRFMSRNAKSLPPTAAYLRKDRYRTGNFLSMPSMPPFAGRSPRSTITIAMPIGP